MLRMIEIREDVSHLTIVMTPSKKIIFIFLLFLTLQGACQVHPHYLKGCINFIEYGFDTINNRWNTKGKLSFVHDKKGKLKKEFFKSWNSENKQWVAQSQTIHKYNKTKQLIESFYKNRSYKTGKLLNSKKTVFTYRKKLLTEEKIYDVSEKKAWLASCINNYEYDSLGKTKRCITSKFNKKTFVVCATETRTYDSLSFLKEIEWENTCSGPADPPLKKTIVYNEDSTKKAETLSTFGRNKEKIEYSYNQEKFIVESKRFEWNQDFFSWKAISRDTFVYNNFGLIIEKINQKFLDTDSAWQNNRSIFYLYNSYLKLLHETEKIWIEKQKRWIPVFRREYKWG